MQDLGPPDPGLIPDLFRSHAFESLVDRSLLSTGSPNEASYSGEEKTRIAFIRASATSFVDANQMESGSEAFRTASSQFRVCRVNSFLLPVELVGRQEQFPFSVRRICFPYRLFPVLFGLICVPAMTKTLSRLYRST
jgi:hypothetical protein